MYTPRRSASIASLHLIFASVYLVVPGIAKAQSPDWLTPGGDIRAGYFNQHRQERDGTSLKTDDFRMRVRLGTGIRLSEEFSAKIRVAGRFSTAQEASSFYIRTHAPTVDGLRLGEATIDEAYLDYRPSERINLRAGRFQSKFVLVDLLTKSLDRLDSPNTDISWTDGAQLTWSAENGWRAHLILQHNAAAGPTNASRNPLDVSDPHSRLTYFTALESTRAWGPIVQRSIDLTFIPGAVHSQNTDGLGDDEDYLALVLRGAAAWPIQGGRLLVGGEAGYAPQTPPRTTLKLPEEASHWTDGGAFQIGVTLADLFEGHRLGIGYARTGPGWLISPDFMNNQQLVEGRYQWQFSQKHSFEARLRRRQELERNLTADRRRDDLDFFFRISSRF